MPCLSKCLIVNSQLLCQLCCRRLKVQQHHQLSFSGASMFARSTIHYQQEKPPKLSPQPDAMLAIQLTAMVHTQKMLYSVKGDSALTACTNPGCCRLHCSTKVDWHAFAPPSSDVTQHHPAAATLAELLTDSWVMVEHDSDQCNSLKYHCTRPIDSCG